MDDGIGLAEALLGLEGFRVLEVSEGAGEVVVTVETVAAIVGCGRCGVRAEAQDRMPIDIHDLACFGDRPVWCGSSSGGAVPTPTATPRPGRSIPTTSTPRPC